MSTHYTITVSSLATSAPPRVIHADSFFKMLAAGSKVIQAVLDAYGTKVKMHEHPLEDDSYIWTLPINGVDTPVVEMIVDETPEEKEGRATKLFA